MNGPKVFISYSHQDETWKDKLVRQLRVLALEGAFDLWDDRRIAAGDGWRAEIETAMEHARAAMLLISADFLTSGFIRGTEVPRLLQRRAQDGLRIIPLIVRPCAWQAVEWLAEMQCRPKDGRALSKVRKATAEEDLAALALEIRDLLRPPGSAGVSPAQTLLDRGAAITLLDLGRLPIPGPNFVGREAEIARLDAAWENPTIHVLTLVAFGGVGKSALVAHWMDRMAADGWRSATRVLDWSFYSQGMEDRVTSAEPFIDYALRFFGDPDPKAGSLYDRGARLARLCPLAGRGTGAGDPSPPRPLRPARGGPGPEGAARRASDPGAHGTSRGPLGRGLAARRHHPAGPQPAGG